MAKRFAAGLLCLALLCGFAFPASAAEDAPDPLSIAQGIIDWKKSETGSSADGFLMNDAFLELAGSTAGDWYAVGLARLGRSDNYAGYLAVLRDRIEARYRQPGRLSAAKATEWHRVTLSILAAGGDPTAFGTDENGNPIDLVADGTYDRGKTTPLGRQGINGWIWGLIAVDAMRCEIPADACSTREDMIAEILSRRLPDGGWALSGDKSDPDLTAMAVQALAPYYEEKKAYRSAQTQGGAENEVTVREAVDGALARLSAIQLPTGDFESWGTQNAESTAQVIIALCCLGIDPLADARFIKNGHTLLDGLLRYRRPDGGFVHSYDYDPNNPDFLPGQSNSMAGEQALLAMAALRRQQNGMRTLYDFRPEEEGAAEPVLFSDEEKQAVDALPHPLTTQQYAAVAALLDRLERSPDFAEKEAYRQRLTAAKEQIAEIQAEIDDLNAQILERLYPFEELSLSDKKTVDSIVSRYYALSEYDRAKIHRREDVVKAKTQLDNLLRARMIEIGLGIAAALLTILLIGRIRRRVRRRAGQTEEPAAQPAEDDET